MNKIVLTAILGVALLSSCSTIKKTATTVDIATSIKQYPVVADGEVKQKVEKTIEWEWNPLKKDNYSLKKGNLVAELLKEVDADVLLEPQFIYQKTSFGPRSITVMGFPVKYKAFRNATADDIKAIEAVKSYNEKEKLNSGNGLLIFKK